MQVDLAFLNELLRNHLILIVGSFCSFCSLGYALHGDLRVCAASPAVALQCFGAAAADTHPQEAYGGGVRPLAKRAWSSGDRPLARAQPSVQIICECSLHMPQITPDALKPVSVTITMSVPGVSDSGTV